MRYKVEQYEIHSQMYHVEADSEAEAIAKVLNGEGENTGEGTEYIETAEDLGMSADDNPELRTALQERSITVHDVIPSIRSIRNLDSDLTDTD